MRPEVTKPWDGDAALQLAMEIEEIGQDFYDALAGLLEDPPRGQAMPGPGEGGGPSPQDLAGLPL